MGGESLPTVASQLRQWSRTGSWRQAALALAQQRRFVVAAVSAFGIIWLQAFLRWFAERRRRARQTHISMYSLLPGAAWKQARPLPAREYWPGGGSHCRWMWDITCERIQEFLGSFGFGFLFQSLPTKWHGGCPSCKRPIELRFTEPWPDREPAPHVKGKYAYVITLWGSSPDYILGALVLGQSLARTGSKHSRLCLHCDDVPPRYIKLISQLWECRVIEHVDACLEKLSFQDGNPHRFDKVFTKLRVMQLTDFEKILLMDIDLIVTANIDDLFDLPAPAALRRGMNEMEYPLKTGDPIYGGPFFGGADPGSKWSWGQGTGINAGVMLLRPDNDTFKKMLVEISDPLHPSHCRGNGPEQDYLSRYWSDKPWTYIGVEYNYQMHQMFYSLHPKWIKSAERASLLKDHTRIKVIHFSGDPEAKPWHRILSSDFANFRAGSLPDRTRDAEYAQLFAEAFMGHWLWVKKDKATWESMADYHARSEFDHLFLGEDGQLYEKAADGRGDATLLDLPPELTNGALKLMRWALDVWFDCFEEMQEAFQGSVATALLKDPSAATISSLAQSPSESAVAGTPSKPTTYWQTREGKSEPSKAASRSSKYGWWMEESRCYGGWDSTKVSVMCGAPGDAPPFVSFCEGGVEVYGERDELELSAIFVKIAESGVRRFSLPAGLDTPSVDPDDEGCRALEEALDPLQFWVSAVPPGSCVMVAMVNLPPAALQMALAMLEPLGVPEDLPSSAGDVRIRALAAAGTTPKRMEMQETKRPDGSGGGWFNGLHGNAGQNQKNRLAQQCRPFWPSCHASTDVAYSCMLLRNDAD
eukprot:TRINITY_DN38227_c0_g1_i1.p1 TRINITY_DN38227_c0_g1~~TRINITY_DN38227_c0_g1_i1.p1  ORF type:complete len:814 (-),score=162.36 TRINITY_DN38227_c0_g1_i1:56-2497(-)